MKNAAKSCPAINMYGRKSPNESGRGIGGRLGTETGVRGYINRLPAKQNVRAINIIKNILLLCLTVGVFVCSRVCVWMTLKLCVKSTPHNAENKTNGNSVLKCSPHKKEKNSA